MYQASIPFILYFKDKVNKITIKNNEPRLIMETMFYERTIKSLIFIVSQNGSQIIFLNALAALIPNNIYNHWFKTIICLWKSAL